MFDSLKHDLPSNSYIIYVIFFLYLQISVFSLLHIIAQCFAIDETLILSINAGSYFFCLPTSFCNKYLILLLTTRNIFTLKYIRNVIPLNEFETYKKYVIISLLTEAELTQSICLLKHCSFLEYHNIDITVNETWECKTLFVLSFLTLFYTRSHNLVTCKHTFYRLLNLSEYQYLKRVDIIYIHVYIYI